METHFYKIDIAWKGGRQGVMCSPELASPHASLGCIEVATPPEFPKGVSGIWSPEHLFTAAVGSCLMTTFLSIAENSKLEFRYFVCHAKGKLERIDGKMIMSEVSLYPEVSISRNQDVDKTVKVLAMAEKACLISNSIRSKVTMVPSVKVVGEASMANTTA